MENYCYECGDDIPKDRHFCNATGRRQETGDSRTDNGDTGKASG
jgi:hypothetical protein